MTRISADFRFHPVGHGLFYSGVIDTLEKSGNPFTFVYDCGGRAAFNQFEEFWSPYKDRGKRLNLLVVSHFHFDHISGISRLIKVAKPRSIVLPYLYPHEKIAYVASLSAESAFGLADENLEEAGKFILDSETFCKLYCENQDCRIYYVKPEKKDEIVNENRDRQMTGITENELYFPDVRLEAGKNNVFDVPNGSIGYIRGWKFHFFMPNIAAFSNEFKIWMKNEGITDDKFKIGSGADDLYKKIKDKFRELSAGTNLNVSNVVCVHGPLEDSGYLSEWGAFAGGYCCCLQGCGICSSIGDVGHCVGIQVLTGDAMFGSEIEAEIEKYKDRCFLFQIPHHGSKNGWQDWFNELPNCKLRPVTHRWNCTYNGKPFMTDRENLIDACHITESSMSALNVRIFT